jgi:hypothetical protein
MRAALTFSLAAALLLVGACDGCSDTPATSTVTTDEASSAQPTPEPWTMGAARADDVVLPPPCKTRDDTLRTVLSRDARIVSAQRTLGQVLVAEGAKPIGAPQHSWRHDASGLMKLTHGRASVQWLPWPFGGKPLVARSAARWLVVRDGGANTSLWRDGESERLGPSPAMGVADLRCENERCALLTTRLDASGAPMAHDKGATLWLGSVDEAAPSWQRVHIPPPDGHAAGPLSIASLSVDGAIVALRDDLRVRFVRVRDGATELVAALSSPHGAMAAIATPRPTALGYSSPPTGDRCADPDAGGVDIVADQGVARRLRSTTPGHSGTLHAIAGGMLVVWLAPARCEAPRQLLHAAVLRPDGSPIAPVITMGEADSYAISSVGADVDMWIRRSGDTPAAATTVSWVRAQCAVPAGSDP